MTRGSHLENMRKQVRIKPTYRGWGSRKKEIAWESAFALLCYDPTPELSPTLELPLIRNH